MKERNDVKIITNTKKVMGRLKTPSHSDALESLGVKSRDGFDSVRLYFNSDLDKWVVEWGEDALEAVNNK